LGPNASSGIYSERIPEEYKNFVRCDPMSQHIDIRSVRDIPYDLPRFKITSNVSVHYSRHAVCGVL
jgi:hypothetical protein